MELKEPKLPNLSDIAYSSGTFGVPFVSNSSRIMHAKALAGTTGLSLLLFASTLELSLAWEMNG